MLRNSLSMEEPSMPITASNAGPGSPTVQDDSNSQHWDVSSNDAFEDSSNSNDAITPSSSTSPLSLRRSSALRRKSISTRSSYEGDSTYYDVSNGSSISEAIEEPNIRRDHPSHPGQDQRLRAHNGQEAIRRTMSVPLSTLADHDDTDIPAPLNISRRTYSLEDPPRGSAGHECAGNVDEDWYFENALLHGLDSSTNQLQVYLLGVSTGHIPPPMDLPASYVVFLPSSQSGSSGASPTIARYRCRYPNCEVKWRGEDEHK